MRVDHFSTCHDVCTNDHSNNTIPYRLVFFLSEEDEPARDKQFSGSCLQSKHREVNGVWLTGVQVWNLSKQRSIELPLSIGHVLVPPEDEITDDNDPGEAHHNECKGQIVPSGDVDEDLARPEVET